MAPSPPIALPPRLLFIAAALLTAHLLLALRRAHLPPLTPPRPAPPLPAPLPRPPAASISQVRLVGGTHPRQGRLEVNIGGSWGTVCDDKFASNPNAARVVCRWLGFTGGALPSPVTRFGQNTGLPIAVDEMTCSGTESTLNSCTFQTTNDCEHSEDVGVECDPPIITVPGELLAAVETGCHPCHCLSMGLYLRCSDQPLAALPLPTPPLLAVPRLLPLPLGTLTCHAVHSRPRCRCCRVQCGVRQPVLRALRGQQLARHLPGQRHALHGKHAHTGRLQAGGLCAVQAPPACVHMPPRLA